MRAEKKMATKSAHVLFALLSLLAVGVGASRIGGWQPIEKPNDIEVVNAAKSAVEEYNKENNKSLVFGSVLKGDQQVVAGAKYRLLISTDSGNYVAVVWSKLDRTTHLISFQKEIHTV